jgi:hypothetical protein
MSAAGRVEVQATLGFGMKFGEARPRVRTVKLAACSMFIMSNDGSGWFPVCLASDGLGFARTLVAERFPGPRVVEVPAVEVDR